MCLLSVLRYALHLLVPLSFILTTYLYLYPAFHLCQFPSPDESYSTSTTYRTALSTVFSPSNARTAAPFRLLTLGDPQLEGDSSIDHLESAEYPALRRLLADLGLRSGSEHSGALQRLRFSLHDLIDLALDDFPKALDVYRKRLDHFGNDYYLGHIYRTMHWWTDPTHITVVGDLVGSQWIDDAEFEHRGRRYWERVFKGGVRVPEEFYRQPVEDYQNHMILGEDAEEWKTRIINVAGNHDIGYAGDISQERIDRFTRVFGNVNYEMRVQMPINSSSSTSEGAEHLPTPELRIVVLNNMNLDTPASSTELQTETYDFLNKVITTSEDVDRRAHFTIVLTHIPLYKEAGVCVDGPFFDFFDGVFNDGIREQNHLSAHASKGFLEGIFGLSGDSEVSGQGFGRHGVIINGHDHEGCNVFHYINQSDAPEQRMWKATTWPEALQRDLVEEPALPSLHEITVRSMMGDFQGNAGMLSLWFDQESWEWQFEFANCQLGSQHIWWVIHIADLITVGVGLVYAALSVAGKYMHNGETAVQEMNASSTKISSPKAPKRSDEAKRSSNEQNNITQRNGHLYVPDSGRKSLKKKRSKLLNEGSPNRPSIANGI